MSGITILILAAGGMLCLLGGISFVSRNYSLNGIRDKTVGKRIFI